LTLEEAVSGIGTLVLAVVGPLPKTARRDVAVRQVAPGRYEASFFCERLIELARSLHPAQRAGGDDRRR
jgi:hypothetical protein